MSTMDFNTSWTQPETHLSSDGGPTLEPNLFGLGARETGLAVATILTAAFLLFLSETPYVPKNVPTFTKIKYPFIGSWQFFARRVSFWRQATAESANGHFSFWLGKNLVVSVSGEAARKTVLEHKAMDHLKAIYLVGLGPDGIDGMKSHLHSIWHTPGGNKSYAQKKTLGCQKTTELMKRIPKLTGETRRVFEEVGAKSEKGDYVSPVFLGAELTWTHATRCFTADALVDVPANRAMLLNYMPMLLFCPSPHLICFPWASYLSPSYWVRKFGRRGFRRMVTPVVMDRMSGKTERVDDPLQTFIDNGDSADYIINFMISMIFVAGANGSGVAGSMLYCVAHHPEIQEKMYNEIKAIANANCAENMKSAPLVDQLDTLPLKAWETLSYTMDLCFKESIRMWVAFPMGRRNDSKQDVPIPGTDQIIPAGELAVYNTIDVHYNDRLYPEPHKWDPARFGEGRKEMEQEAHGFMGWGGGNHACNGMRFAKIGQNIFMSYALVMYEWSGVKKDGSPDNVFTAPSIVANEANLGLPIKCFLKPTPRH